MVNSQVFKSMSDLEDGSMILCTGGTYSMGEGTGYLNVLYVINLQISCNETHHRSITVHGSVFMAW